MGLYRGSPTFSLGDGMELVDQVLVEVIHSESVVRISNGFQVHVARVLNVRTKDGDLFIRVVLPLVRKELV